MKCPSCGSEQVNPSRIAGRYLCLNCGRTFDLQGERQGHWTDRRRG
jgi:transposase-like protein